MIIALDYDNTFTADTKCWLKIIDMLQKHGHDVVIVTSRFEIFENKREITNATGLPVIFCNHNGKAESAKKQGYVPDIWIDDDPWSIVGVDKCD